MSVKVRSEHSDPPAELSLTFPYATDNFQNNAFNAIEQGDHVLVTAHTGSGKTTVAEYAVAYGLKLKKRVYYTAPIKALSNQIFGDFRRKYPSWDVGIKTGDIDLNSSAQVVIMTTECLLNMLLLGEKLDDVGVVIFDEVHYIKDEERGEVWEKSIYMMPEHIQMIMLSATLPDAIVTAKWIAECKGRDVSYTTTTRRIIPLSHYMFLRGGDKRIIIMDNDGKFYSDNYQKACKEYDFTPSMLNYYVDRLKLPALFFCFSKKHCEEHALRINTSLVDCKTSSEIEHAFNKMLRKFTNHTELDGYSQTVSVRQLACKGVCFHHAGLLPQLKEIVQELFSQGFIKVLFVTETFAAGVNMPAKTVVFTGFSKYDNSKGGIEGQFRHLYTEEYLQMAGRAGRRGLDTVGDVVLLPFQPRDILPLHEAKSMMSGDIRYITSRLKITYSYILKSILSKTPIIYYLQKSLRYVQQEAEKVQLQTKLEATTRERHMYKLPDESDDIYALVQEHSIHKNTNMANKARQRKHQKVLQSLSSEKRTYLDKVYDDYCKIQELDGTIGVLEHDIRSIDAAFQEETDTILKFLYSCGYLNKEASIDDYLPEDVTVKGVMCAEINECNPLLLVELITNKYFDGLDAGETIALLALFLDVKSGDRDMAYDDRFRKYIIDCSTLAEQMDVEESHLGITQSNWNLCDELCDVVMIWIKYGNMSNVYSVTGCALFEGELVRQLLKLNNICKEVCKVAHILNDDDLLKKLEKHQELLVRGIVMPDSLYCMG